MCNSEKRCWVKALRYCTGVQLRKRPCCRPLEISSLWTCSCVWHVISDYIIVCDALAIPSKHSCKKKETNRWASFPLTWCSSVPHLYPDNGDNSSSLHLQWISTSVDVFVHMCRWVYMKHVPAFRMNVSASLSHVQPCGQTCVIGPYVLPSMNGPARCHHTSVLKFLIVLLCCCNTPENPSTSVTMTSTERREELYFYCPLSFISNHSCPISNCRWIHMEE